MENGKAEEGDDGHVDETDLHLAQLHALWAELKASVGEVSRDVAALQQGGRQTEEGLATHHRDNNEKMLSIRNTINTIQEDLSGVLAQISQLNFKQKELQRELDLLQTSQHRGLPGYLDRKNSRGEGSLDGHASLSSQTELSLIQHYITSLPSNQGMSPEADGLCQALRSGSRSPVWRERKESKDLTEQSNQELSKRQTAALELLESERVYVSYLSLLLKANITFNGSENAGHKDKRPFPSSLRFLIQQHLELLHVLQERVLKSPWQGIMGDVFLRLTSKESDFLEHYVSYLKELPECVSVVSLFGSGSSKPACFIEGDVMGDEPRPSLHSLLLQPVQRIPEYLALLQSLLRQTECEHPDYYLLLVCVQQLRSFTTQHSHLLQHNQEMLTHPHTHTHPHAHTHSHSHTHAHPYTPRPQQHHPHERLLHTRKELSRSSVKQLYKMGDYEPAINYCSPSALLEPGSRRSKPSSSKRYQDYQDPDSLQQGRYDPPVATAPALPSPVSFLPDAADPRLKPPPPVPPPLRSIPEADGAGAGLGLGLGVGAGSALASALGAFLPYEGGDSLCDRCSHSASPSSDSSIDIAFVHCSPAPSPALHQSHHSGAGKRTNDVVSGGGGGGGGRSGYQRGGRGCVSPDSVGLMRPRPLQAVQRKSKSLNGLQLDTIDSSSSAHMDGSSSAHLSRNAHHRLERQSSAKGRLRHLDTHTHTHTPPGSAHTHADYEDPAHLTHTKDLSSGWEELKWKGVSDENSHTPLSDRSRKQEGKGFRSSFKKLFKKKSSGEGKEKEKEKEREKLESGGDLESCRSPRGGNRLGDGDRGTAV